VGGVSAGGSVPEDVLVARAYLSRVAEPATPAVWEFVEREGAVAAAGAIRRASAPAAVCSATAARRDDVDGGADLEAAQRHGVRLVVPEANDWPHFALGALYRAGIRRVAELAVGARPDASGEPIPPIALWVRDGGADLAALGTRAVAIVGARAATAYGEHVAAELSYGLARADVTIVSGGAYGIDAAAHRAALAAQGQTVIVSAGGLDQPYPAGNSELFRRVAEGGLVISESPPGTAPQRHRFLTRNRLIAAFSAGTVVVEAARRSGAANTASHCGALGLVVMAVPGPVTSAMSAGCHALLRRQPDPAVLVTGVHDVLDAVGFTATDTDDDDAAPPSGDARQCAIDALDVTARRVFDGLSVGQFAAPAAIARRSGVPVPDVVRALPALELAGLLEVSDAGYRARSRVAS